MLRQGGITVMAEKRAGPTGFRWDVLTIGHLSRNRYWGESDDRAYREPRCTCTLIRSGRFTVVVDPGLPCEEMARVLDQRAGLAPGSIDMVFLTHFHGDHRVGLETFPDADWRMAPSEFEHQRNQIAVDSPDREILELLQPAGSELIPGIRVVETPGHSAGHASLMFDSEGKRIAVAGDAAMTRDFFQHRDYYFNTVDPGAAVASIQIIAAAADIVVPGHDNYFLNRRLE